MRLTDKCKLHLFFMQLLSDKRACSRKKLLYYSYLKIKSLNPFQKEKDYYQAEEIRWEIRVYLY